MGKDRREEKMTYAGSGVDIDRDGKAVGELVSRLSFRRKGLGAPVALKGNFTGLIDFGDHYLSLCTDGVGSKIKIAEALNKWDTIGIDCMAMNVNDMICAGVEPIAFVDYIAAESPDDDRLSMIGKGLDRGAEMSNLSIIGGETATLPDIIDGLDLAGTCLGFVRKEDLITCESVGEGDVLIGLPSSGLHSNGYTLARAIIEENDISYISPVEEVIGSKVWKNRRRYPAYKKQVRKWAKSSGSRVVGEILLTPTRIYVKEILELLANVDRSLIHGIANITGGGFRNLSRLDNDLSYVIDDPLEIPETFRLLQVLGSVDEDEMFQTFNMGMGMCLAVDGCAIDDVLSRLGPHGGKIVGHIERGTGVHVPGPKVDLDVYV